MIVYRRHFTFIISLNSLKKLTRHVLFLSPLYRRGKERINSEAGALNQAI